MEQTHTRIGRRRLCGKLERNTSCQCRICRLRYGPRSCGGKLGTRGQQRWALQLSVYRRLHPQRDQAASALGQVVGEYLLRDETGLQLLERLLNRWTPGIPTGAGV